MNNSEYDELFEKNKYLVYKIASRFKSKFVEYEDLVQAGFMGLLKAIRNCRNEATFLSYATKYIVSEIKMEIRNNSYFKVSDYFYKLGNKIKKIDIDDYEELARLTNTSIENVILVKNYGFYSIEKIDDYDLYPSCGLKIPLGLDKIEEEILKLRVVYHYSQKEIGHHLGVSQTTVSRILKNIVEKLV